MAQSTYETLLKALEEKTKRENAEASDTEQRYYASRVASQQQAQEQRQQNNVFDFTNQRANNAIAMQQNQDYEQPITQIESEEESDSWWDSFWAKTNEILLGLGFAVMKPLEGIVDAGAHVVGWIADKAGNTDLAQGVKDFTARDLTKEAMQSAPYQWMNYATIGGVQDLIGSAIDGEWKVKGPYESKMWRRSTDDEYESPEWARKTAEGVGQAVGYALLALATGGVGSAIAGGGELGAVGSAVANYAPIAISAGGSATSEALQEGASYDQAMAYGALSGLTEAAAEAFVGNAVNKALGGVGGGVGALSTVKNLKGGKGIIRGLVASANEEGMEEVFSSVLTPMWKAITYKNNEDNTFAQRYAKEFEEAGGILGVLQDYAYGAASSLIMGGATVSSNIVRSSDTKTVAGLKRGLQTVQMEDYISQVAEIQNDIANEKLKIGLKDGEATTPKLKRLEAKLEKLQSEMETKFKDLLDHIEEYSNTETEGLNNAQRKQIATKEAYETSKNVDTDMLAINKLFEDSKVEALESQKAVKAYDERIKALDEQLRTNTTLTTEQMNAIRKEMTDNQKARDRIANNWGLYDPETSTTYIEGKRTLRDKFKTALHERLHVALKDASVDNKIRVNELIKKQILNDANYGKEWFEKELEKKKSEYRKEFEASNDYQKSGMKLDKAINSGKFDYWFEEEISADYLFNLFKNPAQAKKVLNGTFGGKGIANTFMNAIRTAYLGKNRPQGYKELIKALQEVSQQQNAKNTKEFNEKLKEERESLKTIKKAENKGNKEESKTEYVEKETKKKTTGELARAQKKIYNEYGWEQSRYNEIEKNTNKTNYRHHNWAIVNHHITQEENAKLAKLVGDLHRGEIFPKSSQTNNYMFEIENKIVFSDGVYNNFSIDKIIEIVANESIDNLKESIYYDEQNNRVYEEHENLFKIYSRDGISYEVWSRNKEVQRGVQNSQRSENGTGSNRETSSIRYSKRVEQKDSEGETLSQNQINYFENSKARDDNGDLIPVYHGTTFEFYEFDKDKANPESNLGKGFYFSNNLSDSTMNYENEETSPDLKSKVNSLADYIEYTDEVDHTTAYERARELLVGHDPRTLKVYLNMQNPVYIGENETVLFDYDEYLSDYSIDDYDNEDDYYQDVDNAFWDNIHDTIYEALTDNEINDASDVTRKIIDKIFEEDYQNITFQKLADILGSSDIFDYLVDEQGKFISYEIARSIAENLGYDGIIDSTVSEKFKMPYMTPDTVHYVVFNSNQIKLTSNKNPSASPDIRYSKKTNVTYTDEVRTAQSDLQRYESNIEKYKDKYEDEDATPGKRSEYALKVLSNMQSLFEEWNYEFETLTDEEDYNALSPNEKKQVYRKIKEIVDLLEGLNDEAQDWESNVDTSGDYQNELTDAQQEKLDERMDEASDYISDLDDILTNMETWLDENTVEETERNAQAEQNAERENYDTRLESLKVNFNNSRENPHFLVEKKVSKLKDDLNNNWSTNFMTGNYEHLNKTSIRKFLNAYNDLMSEYNKYANKLYDNVKEYGYTREQVEEAIKREMQADISKIMEIKEGVERINLERYYEVQTQEQIDANLQATQENIDTDEEKRTLPQDICDSLTRAFDNVKSGGIEFGYVANYGVFAIDNLSLNKNQRKKQIKAKLLEGMVVKDKADNRFKRLDLLPNGNSVRVYIESYVSNIVESLFNPNANVVEDAQVLNNVVASQAEEISLTQDANPEITNINVEIDELTKENDKLKKEIRAAQKKIKELKAKNEEGTRAYQIIVEKLADFNERVNYTNNKIEAKIKAKDSEIKAVKKQVREAMKQTRELNKKLINTKNKVNEYFAKLVKARIEAKGKFKVNEDFVSFLQNWGEYFSPYPNFKLNLADCERIGMLLENPNETHKVIIDDVETTLTNREIALTYYYNKINGTSQQYTSIYHYDMSYQEIFDLIKEGFDVNNTGIATGKENATVEMALEHVLDDITTTDLTDIGKQQEKYEKLLDKARERTLAQYQRYLNKNGELSLYKHSVWAKNRARSFKNKLESYKSKFGRLSGISDKWAAMLEKFSNDINALTSNQIANGEFVGALKEFYNTYLSIKGELNKKNIYMPVELEKTIEQIAYANRTDLSKEEDLNVIDSTLITKEDIDLFSQIISGINRFMTDAKEERGAMLAGKWTKLKDASTTGIAEQDYLLEQNKKHNIKYDKYHFINGYVNPAVNFRYWDGFKTDGIFSKFYQTLELAQNKYAQNMIELMQPFADFAKKYKKEFNSLRDKATGIKVNGVELNGTNGQILALYETMKRLWAVEHLNACGFVLNENSKIGFDGGEVIRDAVKDWVSNNFNLSTKDSAKVEELILKAVNSKTNVMLDEIRLELADKYGYDFDFDIFKEEMKELKNIRSEAVREQISQLSEDIENKYKLNDKDSAYAQYLKASEDFFEKARELKVEADMQILGFTNVSDDFYFPMYTSSLDNQVNLGELNYDNQTMSSRDYSFNQNLRSIMGALEIRNIDDIINVHLQQTATYNAYSPAIETIKRVYNWKQSGDQAGRTVANAMKLRYTKEDAGKIDKYLHNLINDIQGGTVGKSNVENSFDKVFNFIRGHSIKVALGANPKVWFSQTTSIPAAMKYIQGKYLVEGLSDLVKTSKGLPEIPYLAQLRKRNGEIIRSETMTSEQDGVLGAVGTGINTVTGAINVVSESMMKPITAFDSAAIRVIWKASLLQTKNTDGSWNVEKATELFTKTVNETQPNYNPLGRPEILRTKNPLLRLLVMYKTQSFQNLSNAYEAVNRIVYKLRRGIPLEQTIKDANGKIISYGDRDKAIRALIALLLQGILFSSLGYLFKRLINNDWGENTGKNLANDLGLGFINDNLLGIMPIINKIQVDLNNDRYVKLNINGFTDNIEDTFTKMMNPESLAPKDYVTIFANLTGIPATNLYKYSKTFLQYVLPNETIEKIDLGYRGKSVNKQLISKASTERLTRTYYNMYTTEINGNIKENTRREMYRLYQNGNASVILKETPEKFTVDGVEYSVIPKEFNQAYGKVSDALNNLISSANYSKLDDEEKGWQIVKLNEAYYGAAKKVATNENFTKFESLAYYDFTFSSDLLSIYHMLTQLEATKKLTKSQVISQYLNKQRVPVGMKYLLWWLAGYGLKNNQKSMVKRYLSQNGVSLRNAKEIIK